MNSKGREGFYRRIVQEDDHVPGMEETVFMLTQVRMFLTAGCAGMVETDIADGDLVVKLRGGKDGTGRMAIPQLMAFVAKYGAGMVARSLAEKMGFPYLEN